MLGWSVILNTLFLGRLIGLRKSELLGSHSNFGKFWGVHFDLIFFFYFRAFSFTVWKT